MNPPAKVHVVDDDPQIRECLTHWLRSVGLEAATYVSAEEFLSNYMDDGQTPCCLVLEVRMPGLSGLGLQKELASTGIEIPSIMISGHADIPTAVQAMSAGAMDYLEKPLSRQTLLQRIMEAIDRSTQIRRRQAQRAEIAARLSTLSVREREVMDLLVVGKHAKHIASELGIGEKTVLKHRSRVMEKMQVDSIAELVRLALTMGDLPLSPKSGNEERGTPGAP